MHIERDICKEVISRELKLHLKKAPGGGNGGFNIFFGTSFSNIFRTFAGSFCNFFPHLPELGYKESFPFLICRREMKQLGEL